MTWGGACDTRSEAPASAPGPCGHERSRPAVAPHVPRLHVHDAPIPSAAGARASREGVPRTRASAHRPPAGLDQAAERAGTAPVDAGLAGVLRLG
jgi:hypothetical protein